MKILKFDEFINEGQYAPHYTTSSSWDDYEIRSKEDLQKKIQEIIDETHPKKGDTIDLNHLDVSRVEDMSNLFFDYRGHIDLTDYNFDVSKWDVSSVRNMKWMFYECRNFNCDLSRWDVSCVEDMHGMFDGCKNFNSDLSRWDVFNVKDMSYMFVKCMNFNCDLSKWNVSKVKDMRLMFDGCDSLEKLPDWYNEED